MSLRGVPSGSTVEPDTDLGIVVAGRVALHVCPSDCAGNGNGRAGGAERPRGARSRCRLRVATVGASTAAAGPARGGGSGQPPYVSQHAVAAMDASSAPIETDVAPLPLPTPGPELADPGSTPSSAGASARPPPAEPPRGDLLVAPVVRLHGGHTGEPVGERSAGFLQFVDGVEAYTHRNLVARLFVNNPEIGGRLIRMGSLYSSVQRGGDTPGATAANVRPPPGDTRTPPERERDSAAYVHMVALAN